MREEEEQQFQSGDICWICEKLSDDGNLKVRDHCHIMGKFRGTAHWNCNINLQLTEKVPVIFLNLRNYDSLSAFKGILWMICSSSMTYFRFRCS